MKNIKKILKILWIVLITFSIQSVKAQTYSTRYVKESDKTVYLNRGDNLKYKLESAQDSSCILISAGEYGINKATIDDVTLFLRGVDKNSTIISGEDTLLTFTGSNIYFQDLSIKSTAEGNALILTDNPTLHFDNCKIEFHFMIFSDSVWAENTSFYCTGGQDSMIFDGYAELINCRQKGSNWCFGANSDSNPIRAKLVNCDGYSETTMNLHIPNQCRDAVVKIYGGFWETTADRYCLGAASQARVEVFNASFIGAGTVQGWAPMYFHDSTTVVAYGNQAFNRNAYGTSAISMTMKGCDSVWVGGNSGNHPCAVDSENAYIPVIYWTDGNFFSGFSTNLSDAQLGANIKTTIAADDKPNIISQGLSLRGHSGFNPTYIFEQYASGGGYKLKSKQAGELMLSSDLYMKGSGNDIKFDWDLSDNKPSMSLGMFVNSGDSTVIMQVDSIYYLEGATNAAR